MKKISKFLTLLLCGTILTSCKEPEARSVRQIRAFGDSLETLPADAHEVVSDVFEMAVDCVAFDLHELGFEVMKGFAIVNEKTYLPGLIFTNYERCDDDFKKFECIAYSCGFVQIKDSSQEGILLTKDLLEDQEQSVVVVVSNISSEETYYFDVSIDTYIKPYAAIYNNHYFKYVQPHLNVVEISVLENKVSNYDENIDLYSLDEGRYIFKADPMEIKSFDAISIYNDEVLAYAKAFDTVQRIIDCQNNNGYSSEELKLTIIDMELIAELQRTQQIGSYGQTLQSQLDRINVEGNEYVYINAEGQMEVREAINTQEALEQRKLNAIAGIITACISIGVDIVIIVSTAGAGTGVAATNILRTLAVVGAKINLFLEMEKLGANVLDEIYASKGYFDAVGKGIVRGVLDGIFGEAVGGTVFDILSIASQVLSVIGNVGCSWTTAAAVGSGFWNTANHFIRITSVKLVKSAITGAATMFVTKKVSSVIEDATGNEYLATIGGVSAGVLAGFLSGKFLDKIDSFFDISGIKTKDTIKEERKKGKILKASDDDDDIINENILVKTEEWQNASTDQREYQVNELVNAFTNDLNIKNKPTVYFTTNPYSDYISSYDPNANVILINEYYWNNPDLTVSELAKMMKLVESTQNFGYLTPAQQDELIKLSTSNTSTNTTPRTQNDCKSITADLPNTSELKQKSDTYSKDVVDELVMEL